MIHRRRKERKDCTANGSQESIDRDGAIRIEAIAIDNVIHALPEGHEASRADECC